MIRFSTFTMKEAENAGTHAQDPVPELQPGLVESLTSAYAMLLKTQRTASSAYVRWTKAHSRSHEFAWIDSGREVLLMSGGNLIIKPESLIHAQIQKMMATMELNPYERELRYGYPYIIGQSGGTKFRAPLLTIPIAISADGGNLVIALTEDAPRFNSLPFRTEAYSNARELAFKRLMDPCPDIPLVEEALRLFCASVVRDWESVLTPDSTATF